MLLDEKVGDVSGRPIFAAEFLEPLAGRLRADARRLPPAQWRETAFQSIAEELRAIVTDELLRAEALSRFDDRQRQGLAFFLQSLRENIAAQAGGSRAAAESRLRSEGLTEDEFVRQRERQELVRLAITEEIDRRVNVSWRDIVRRYRRDENEYNPPAAASFWLMGVSADDPEAVRDAQLLIDRGLFERAAGESYNTLRTSSVAKRTVTFEEFATITPYGPEEVNEAARQLLLGGVSDAIELGSRVYWVKYTDLVDEATSLYDAQIGISGQLRSERRTQELERYIDRLIERSKIRDLNTIGTRLLETATLWYGPESLRTSLEDGPSASTP